MLPVLPSAFETRLHHARPALPCSPAGFHTQFQGYSVRFSPFEESRLAVATSQNFGIIGNGRQYVLQVGSGLGQLAGGWYAGHLLIVL
jgi:hypothetical protein